MQGPVSRVAQAASGADAVFIPEGPEVVPAVAKALASAGLDLRRVQLLGTGLWDDPRITGEPVLQGGWYAAPDSSGFRNFSARYRSRYGQDPCAPRRSPMTRWRWSPRWSRPRARSGSPAGADQCVRLRRYRWVFRFAPTAPTSAGSR